MHGFRRSGGRRRVGSGVLLTLILAALLGPAGPADSAPPVDVEAGEISYESDGQVVHASGGVVATWADKKLRADAVRFERDAGRLSVEGGLVLETPDLTLRADSCQLRVDDETATLKNVSLSANDSPARFGGRSVQKLRGNRYTLRRGYYTTCKSEKGQPPDWQLAGRRVQFELDGNGTVRDGTFRVKGVPVLYFPYLRFPVRVRRQTGLLLPRIGLSNERGFIYSQPLYWAINKHHDATFTFDLETAARVGGEFEYRYAPRRGMAGTIEFAGYNERIRGDARSQIVSPLFAGRTIPNNRAMVQAQHRQELSADTDLYVDLLLVSDDLLLREVESVATRSERRALQRSRRYSDTRIGLLRRRGFTSLGARSRFFQDFVGADRLTVHKPLELWAARDGELGYGVGYSVSGALASFRRTRGSDGQRFDVVADLERVLAPRLPVHANAWLRGRLTAYRLGDSNKVDSAGSVVGELASHAARPLAEAGVDVRSAFARRFELPSWSRPLLGTSVGKETSEQAGTRSIDHTIEPFAKLRATTNSRARDLPLFDEVDRIDGRSVATYGVASRFLLPAHDGKDQFEVLRVSAEQSYNIDNRIIDDHLSDLDLTLSLRSRLGYAVRGLASYNVGQGRLMGAASVVSFEDFSLPFTEERGSRIQAVYRFVRGEVLETTEGRAIFALTPRLSLGVNGRFDFVSSTFVESGGGFRYRSGCGCWAVDFGVVNRVNPDELQVRVEVELSGLGSLGSSPLFKTSQRLSALYGVDRGYRRLGW